MFIDITTPLSPQTPTWRNEQPFQLDVFKTIGKDGVNVTAMTMGSHSGTHVDAPRHFLAEGETIDHVSLEALNGPCRVIRVQTQALVSRADLVPHRIHPGERILIRANDGVLDRPTFQQEFHAIERDAAMYLVSRKIILIGIDYLSVERSGTPGHPTHMAFLQNDIVVVEGLELKNVRPGRYILHCLPLKIVGGDGAPARAVLEKEE